MFASRGYSLGLRLFWQAIANLSVNAEVAKCVAMEGGISILAMLARSPNRWVAEEAAGGLWNLSVGEEHKVKIKLFKFIQMDLKSNGGIQRQN